MLYDFFLLSGKCGCNQMISWIAALTSSRLQQTPHIPPRKPLITWMEHRINSIPPKTRRMEKRVKFHSTIFLGSRHSDHLSRSSRYLFIAIKNVLETHDSVKHVTPWYLMYIKRAVAIWGPNSCTTNLVSGDEGSKGLLHAKLPDTLECKSSY